MKRLICMTAMIVAVSIFNATTPLSAQDTQPAEQAQAAPATQPDGGSLPQGHPPLPQGHPELPQDQPELPQGHPPLPADHPQIPAQTPGGITTGSLMIKAVQGTQDGPAIAGGQAVVNIYQGSGLLKKLTIHLDAKGTAVITGIPLDPPVQPVAIIEYAGVTYESVGRPMGPNDPEQLISLKVYETTDTAPQWRIAMRHVMANQIDQHLHLTEIWSINNPTDRSYIGVANELASVQDDETKHDHPHNTGRTTLALPIPVGANNVQPGQGFHTGGFELQGGQILNSMPLLPGTTEFRVDYMLLPEDGLFNLALANPAAIDHLMVILPDNGLEVTAQGLETAAPFEAGEKTFRMYSAKQVQPGTSTSLVIQAPDAPPDEAVHGAAAPASQAVMIKLIAGGGAVLLVFAGTFVMLKPKKKSGPSSAAA